jgi:eukaryotic-like serine/threonine-protein kinase
VEALQAGDPQRMGPYELVGRLGGGGMGRVFAGRSPGGRLVAVKVIRPELAESADFRVRFGREVAAARKVNGLCTALVVDADTDGPAPWLATAYVAGPSLAQAVAAHGPLPAATVLAMAAGLAEGLAEVHAAGIVHRDLKPSNVLLAEDGPRVIDFGISQAAEASALTHTGMVVGSPGFMSPEQAEGRPVGPASDLFSLGAVLVYAATGEGPFGAGSTPALVYRVVHTMPNLDHVPPLVRPLVERCLAKDPAQRPTTGQILAELPEVQPTAGLAHWLPPSIAREFAPSALADGPASPAPVAPATPSGQATPAPADGGPAAGPHDPAVPVPAAPSPGSPPVPPPSARTPPPGPAAPGAGGPSTITAAPFQQDGMVPGLAERSPTAVVWPAPAAGTRGAVDGPGSQAAPAGAPGGPALPVLSAATPVPPAAAPAWPVTAPGAAAGSRPRWRRWAIAVGAVAAAIGLGASLAVWAPWTRPTPAPPRPAPVLQPTGLTAGTATTSSVTISWSAPLSGPLPSGYIIVQNGTVIASVPGAVTSYQATGLDPGTSYSYQVTAIRGGRRSARSSPIAVTTLTPPISAAILTGSWTVHYKHLTWYGTNFTPHFRPDTWTFTPKCAAGPCSVKLAGTLQGWPLSMTLHRSGTVYRGMGTTKDYFTCEGASEVTDVTIRMKVSGGQVDGTQWLADSWAGTINLYAPPSACTASGITASIHSHQ